MAALDTNVLVRHLVQDDAAQSRAAARLIARGVADGRPLHVPVSVTLELEWVLRSGYGFTKTDTVDTLSALLSTRELVFEAEQALEAALHAFRQSGADFADCLHVALAFHAGASPLLTFDRRAAKLAGARLVPSRPGASSLTP